jgi:hypothetical protein
MGSWKSIQRRLYEQEQTKGGHARNPLYEKESYRAMKSKQPFVSFVCWTVFIFALLVATNLIEHKVSIAVGSHLSSDYARWTADSHKSRDVIRAKDPDGWRYVTWRVGFCIFAIYGITASIIAGCTVWWQRDSRGMPNESAMNQPHLPRNSWSNILGGIGIVLCGLLCCASGITALKTHTMVPGNWKWPPTSGENALFSGVVFVAGGSIWLWSCFRKER